MQLSSTQKEIIRTRPASTHLDLFLFQPRTIFQAQINDGSIAKGARVITYNNVTLGGYSSIEAGMTLLIGTTAGADDVGRIRIKSTATSTQITVSENSNINWANSLYLTVLRYWELWPVFPRLISDPNNAENVLFYKDYDIAYSNQNSYLGTFVNAGPHRPVLLENGSAQVWYSSTGTYNLLSHALTYNWSFEGGTPTGSTSADPGYVTYNTAGNYVTRLIVTDSVNGTQDTTYRFVAVRDAIGQGSNTPVVRWTMEELAGSRAEGGYAVRFTLFDTVSIDDNAVVMLYSRDSYGAQEISLGGNYPNGSNIFFVGHIDKDTIQYDYRHSQVQFNAISLTGLMKNSLGFSVSVESKASPTTWYELLEMDVRRALYHYLKWHTTVLSIADFQFVGTDYAIQFFDSDRASMYDAIDNLMRNTLIGQVVSDRQNKIWAEVQAMAYSNPTGSFPNVFDITNRDWMGMPELVETVSDEYSYIEMGGIQYNGPTANTFAALLTCAPGSSPSFRGKVEKSTGLALGSQSHLNTLSGNVFYNRNSRFPNISMDLTSNLRNFDIAPQESSQVTLQPSDTVRNIALSKLFIPETISWRYNSNDHITLPIINFKNILSSPIVGDTIIVPNVSDLMPGFNMRIPNPKLYPPYPPIPTTPSTSSVSNLVVAIIYSKGVYYTTDFSSASPHWFAMNSGIDAGDLLTLQQVEITSSGRLFLQGGQNKIYTAPSVGSAWTTVVDYQTIGVLSGGLASEGHINCMGINRGAADELMLLGGKNGVAFAADFWFKGTSAGITKKGTYLEGTYHNYLLSTGYIYYGTNGWTSLAPAYQKRHVQTDAEGSGIVRSNSFGNNIDDGSFMIKGGKTGTTTYFFVDGSPGVIKKSTDDGQTFSDCAAFEVYSGFPTFKNQSLGVDPTNTYLIGGDIAGILTKRSSDGGATWGIITSLSGTTKAVWNMGSSGSWVLGWTGRVIYTGDFGTNFADKTGDLWTYTGSTPDIIVLRSILP